MRTRLTTLVVLLSLALVVALSGCRGINSPFGIRGSGNKVTETRTVSGFNGVVLSAAGRVNITVGDSESLTVTGDDNILPLVDTTVIGGKLVIEFTQNNINLGGLTSLAFTITVKSLNSLEISGAGEMVTNNVNTDALDVKMNGVGSITANGKANSQNIAISGAGLYDGTDLASQTAVVRISGAGTATVWAAQTLDATISGLGTVNYYGEPVVTKNITGVGTVVSKGAKSDSSG